MVSKFTTHSFADFLEEVISALRQMPDIPLSDLQSSRPRKPKQTLASMEIADELPHLEKNEATVRLNKLGQRELLQLSKHLKIHVGSKRTKASLVSHVLWHFFGAKDDLERIRTYEDKSKQDNENVGGSFQP